MGIATKYFAWYSNMNEIKWNPLEVMNWIPGQRGEKITKSFHFIMQIDI